MNVTFFDCLIPFIIGGIFAMILTILIKSTSPKIGAMFYALPLSFIIAILLLYPDQVGEFALETIPAGICFSCFILIFAIVFHENNKKTVSSLIFSILIWIPIVYIVFKTIGRNK